MILTLGFDLSVHIHQKLTSKTFNVGYFQWYVSMTFCKNTIGHSIINRSMSCVGEPIDPFINLVLASLLYIYVLCKQIFIKDED